METTTSSPTVFVSYCHADEKWLKRLQVHLRPLIRDRTLDMWDDTRIAAGSFWLNEIEKAIERAAVGILLVSADFLASDFVMRKEVPALLRLARERGMTIIPILVGPSRFEKIEELSGFQAVNQPSRTLSEMTSAECDTVFVRISDSVAASLSQRLPDYGPPDEITDPRREVFNDTMHWKRLYKIGPWEMQNEGIIGEGVYTYLLSERSYGSIPYVVIAKLRLIRYAEYANDGSCTANAGLVFGWNEGDNGPRYYNLLFSGKRMLLEEVGFSGGDEFGDYRHLSEGIPFRISEEQDLDITVRVNSSIDVWVDNRPIYSVQRPSRLLGKVGLRPWRARIQCKYFEVRNVGAANRA